MLKITELALFNGIDKDAPGNVLDDISGAVEDTALGAASNIPKELQGKKIWYCASVRRAWSWAEYA